MEQNKKLAAVIAKYRQVDSKVLAGVLLDKVEGHRSLLQSIPSTRSPSNLVRRLKKIQVIDNLEHNRR